MMWAAFAAATGLLFLASYAWILRHDARVVPVAVATAATFETIWEGSARAYPGALGGALIAIGFIWLAAYAWIRALSRSGEPEAVSAPTSSAVAV
jgi:hypothetical protein